MSDQNQTILPEGNLDQMVTAAKRAGCFNDYSMRRAFHLGWDARAEAALSSEQPSEVSNSSEFQKTETLKLDGRIVPAIAKRIHEAYCGRANCDEHCKGEYKYETAHDVLVMVTEQAQDDSDPNAILCLGCRKWYEAKCPDCEPAGHFVGNWEGVCVHCGKRQDDHRCIAHYECRHD